MKNAEAAGKVSKCNQSSKLDSPLELKKEKKANRCNEFIRDFI